jgi:hypothetical protein
MKIQVWKGMEGEGGEYKKVEKRRMKKKKKILN